MWWMSLLASFLSLGAPGDQRHERVLAALYAMAESHEMMSEVAGPENNPPERGLIGVYADGEAPVQIEDDWSGPAHQYTVVVERPAVLEADGVHCNPRLEERVRESWYTLCVLEKDDDSWCSVISIEAVCCVTGNESNPGRCPEG